MGHRIRGLSHWRLLRKRAAKTSLHTPHTHTHYPVAVAQSLSQYQTGSRGALKGHHTGGESDNPGDGVTTSGRWNICVGREWPQCLVYRDFVRFGLDWRNIHKAVMVIVHH